MPATIDAKRSALLLIDLQASILAGFPNETDSYLKRVGGVADAARAAGVPVIYVIVSFRPGHPEISPRNKMFGGLKAAGRLVDETVHPAIAPRDGELVVLKRRVSIFNGSEMEMLLRAHDIDNLILAGVSTAGCILSSIRYAADADFSLTVLSDGCMDGDAQVHSVLMEKVFPRQAEVKTCAEMIAALGQA